MAQLSHLYMDYWKNHSCEYMDFVSKAMSLLSNMLPVFVITFFLRSKGFLMSWLQPPCTVTLEPRKQDLSRFCFLLFYLPCSDGTGYYGFHFFINIDFVLSSFNLIKRLFSSSLLSAIRVVASAYMILFHTEMIPAVGPITITWV